ncbi:hypothetical protein HY29_10220 [Hyphomonas beringensis]|uniref:Uncharacterized protein n=1 Tax=Hyphomonas beringensis TaxID=1280946 RepID=A0A062UCC2_9PROT|nr:hypothetical protein [Hyphomonas beringensis]KCZ55972.1 hypothetical protein HY29_10220 [Hyphomonas beringensis]
MPDRDSLQKLWAAQPVEPFSLSPDELRNRARKFQSSLRMRNMTEYLAALVVIGIFGWMAILIPVPVVKLGAVLTIIGALYVSWKLHTYSGSGLGQGGDAADSLIRYHRRELVRQRAALANVWRWYLLPFLPGALLFVAGVSFAPDTGLPFLLALPGFLFSLAIMGGVAYGIIWLNNRSVRQLDAEIAELDKAAEG